MGEAMASNNGSGLPRRTPLSGSAAATGENPLRAGMPMRDTIHSREMLASPRPGGRTYRVIRTTEIDAYEMRGRPEAKVLSRATLMAAPVDDKFRGKARKAAKLSIVSAEVESFTDLHKLIGSLLADEEMIAHDPPISISSKSVRVAEEKRNVRVAAFLYAASREDDNDYHLIIGRDPDLTPESYMTMELSGLPPATSKSHKRLKTARTSYKTFFGDQLPGLTYDFYDPPIPLEVEGSLFFDMSHSTGQRPGPQSLKSRMPTIWEVHPISRIEFEP